MELDSYGGEGRVSAYSLVYVAESQLESVYGQGGLLGSGSGGADAELEGLPTTVVAAVREDREKCRLPGPALGEARLPPSPPLIAPMASVTEGYPVRSGLNSWMDDDFYGP